MKKTWATVDEAKAVAYVKEISGMQEPRVFTVGAGRITFVVPAPATAKVVAALEEVFSGQEEPCASFSMSERHKFWRVSAHRAVLLTMFGSRHRFNQLSIIDLTRV